MSCRTEVERHPEAGGIVAIPANGTTFHTIARAVFPCESVHYRISSANCRPVCPPQGIRPVPQPRAIGPGIYGCSRHTTRLALIDANVRSAALIQAYRVRPIDCSCRRRSRRRSARQGRRRAEHYENTWHGMNIGGMSSPRLMQGDLLGAMRLTRRIALVVARAEFVRQRGSAAGPGIARTDDRHVARR